MNNKEIKPESAYFRQTRIKLQSRALSHEVAWREAQGFFQESVPEYPQINQVYGKLLSDVFAIRRQTYFTIYNRSAQVVDERTIYDLTQKDSVEIMGKLEKLSDEERTKIAPPVVIIRDLFNVPVPPTGRRRG